MAGYVDRALVILLSANTDGDKIRFSELLPVLRRLTCSPDPLHPAAVLGLDEKTAIRYAHAAPATAGVSRRARRSLLFPHERKGHNAPQSLKPMSSR